MSNEDMFEDVFERQEKFMELLRSHDKLPEWPVDLTTKPGQRLIKESVYCVIEELMEASMTLRNKIHRVTDVRVLDIAHYKEELGDAFAYLVEVCILSGFTPQEIYAEYKRKNAIVSERLKNGY